MLRLQVHHPSHEIIVDGKRIVPNPSEMAIISELFLHRKKVVSYRKLEQVLRRLDHAKDLYRRNGNVAAGLAVYMTFLRRKLGDSAQILVIDENGNSKRGRGCTGIGYMLIVNTTNPISLKNAA